MFRSIHDHKKIYMDFNKKIERMGKGKENRNKKVHVYVKTCTSYK